VCASLNFEALKCLATVGQPWSSAGTSLASLFGALVELDGSGSAGAPPTTRSEPVPTIESFGWFYLYCSYREAEVNVS
jgi:hypothetical protein